MLQTMMLGPEQAYMQPCIDSEQACVFTHGSFCRYSSELQPMLSQRLAVFVAGNPPDGVIANVLQVHTHKAQTPHT